MTGMIPGLPRAVAPARPAGMRPVLGQAVDLHGALDGRALGHPIGAARDVGNRGQEGVVLLVSLTLLQ